MIYQIMIIRDSPIKMTKKKIQLHKQKKHHGNLEDCNSYNHNNDYK